MRHVEFDDVVYCPEFGSLEDCSGFGGMIVPGASAPCFICGEMTDRIDLGFEAWFCDSGICWWAVSEDIRMKLGVADLVDEPLP